MIITIFFISNNYFIQILFTINIILNSYSTLSNLTFIS